MAHRHHHHQRLDTVSPVSNQTEKKEKKGKSYFWQPRLKRKKNLVSIIITFFYHNDWKMNEINLSLCVHHKLDVFLSCWISASSTNQKLKMTVQKKVKIKKIKREKVNQILTPCPVVDKIGFVLDIDPQSIMTMMIIAIHR